MQAVGLLLLLLPLVSATKPAYNLKLGPCPSPPVQPHFNINKFMGVWYEIERIPNKHGEGNCVKAKYTKKNDDTISAVHSAVVNGKIKKVEGVIKVVCPDEPAKLGISHSCYQPHRPFWVLCTDYSNYAVVYSCRDHHLFHYEYAWILARSCRPCPRKIKFAKEVLEHAGIDTSHMIATDHTRCG